MDTPKQPDQTRARILDAAFAEIHRHGFQAASIATILASTGLTKGALYHHFPTKQALGLAVVDEKIRARLETKLIRPLRESAHPLLTLLELLQALSSRAAEIVPLGCPLNNLMQEMSPLDPEFKIHLNAVLDAWQSTLASALQCAQAQGEVRADVDCKAAALFIISAWEGCIGVAKNLQSPETLATCSLQLQNYVRSLGPLPGQG